MAITIAVLSQKGGTGKTTMTRSLADVFERIGLQTLAVDADPQGNLSDYFDTDPAAQPTLGEVLAGQARATEAIHGSVIPANLGLAEAELILSGKMGRELTLRNALREPKRRYDVVLIDCPRPSGCSPSTPSAPPITPCSRPRPSTSRCRGSSRRSR